MKKFFPVVIRRSAAIIFNKAVCLNLALVMLFNLTSPVFASASQNKQEEERLLQELNQELQAEYAKQIATPIQSAFDLCINKNNQSACDKYISEVNKMFTNTAEDTAKGQGNKEEVFKPMTKKAYISALKDNTKNEFETNANEIGQEYQKQAERLEAQFKGVSITSLEYSNYIFAKTALENWKKERLQALTNWQKEILASSDSLYQTYLAEFDQLVEEYKNDREEALNEYLRELAGEVMSVYEKASATSRLKLVPVLGYLLSMESQKARLFNSAQKSEIYKFFNRVISPSDKSNPCRFHTRDRKANELSVYNAWQDQLRRMEEETQGTVSARDQVAAQTRGYQQRISNDLRAPITELADEQACQAAMSALTGLSYFKGWDMSNVSLFMTKNAMEPMASEVLLMGTQTLIEANRVDAFSILSQYMVDMEMTYEDEDDLKLKEAAFFDGRFYKTPYYTSRYSEEDGGGDVWQDIAKMLSNLKTITAKQMQEQILDRAVHFSIGNGKLQFNHNLPFVYGLLLHNPKLIDNFVPSSALAFTFGTYMYNGKVVYFQYNENGAELYIKEKGKAPFYLGDNTEIRNAANNVSRKVGDVRREAYQKYLDSLGSKRAAYFRYFKEQRGGLKPSAVFAEAFYKADFVDLTADEKFAMDKALEEKYPHLKNISSGHKKQLERNRLRADRVRGGLVIIDVAFTLWFVSDIYKGIKWSIKGVKALRQLFKAGKAVKGLSDARRVAFLRTFAKKNPNAVKLNRKLNRVKTMPQRVANNLPKYKANLKAKVNNFNEFMMKTGDYMGAPSGMQGQRVAVSTYNRAIGVPHRQVSYASKYAKAASQAKVVGPINIFDKKGNLRGYKDIKFNEEGILEVDGDLFKTYKTMMKPDDIIIYDKLISKTIADLERELELNKDRIAFLAREYKKADALGEAELLEYEKFKNMIKTLEELKESRYVTFYFDEVKNLSIAEKWHYHEQGYTLLPIYNAEGQVIFQVSFDNALRAAQDLIKEVNNGKKIILKDGKIFLDNEILNVTVGAPKSTISLLGKAGAKVEDLSFLTLRQKNSKMFSLIFNNALTFSAASTSLNLSLAKAPFSISKEDGNPNYVTQWVNTCLSVAVPYAFSFLSPMVAPFVKRYGASRTQVFSLGIAGTGMTVAAFSGYSGFATKMRDEKGNLVYDENGKTITAKKAPSIWPLWIAAVTSGISSSLTRASLNIAINRYQVSKATMATSMVAKNIGSLFMTIIPAVADASFQHHRDNFDFSISYPVLAGLSVVGAGLMLRNIPSSVAKEANYLIMPNKLRSEKKGFQLLMSPSEMWRVRPRASDWADMGKATIRPFALINPLSKTKTIIPYYLTFMSFGATESYALFKVYNSFSRDSVEDFTEGTGFTGNDNKLLASLIATLPSALVRGLWKRKGNFSQGLFNNILLTSSGIVLLFMPSENLTTNQNLALGLTSGCLLGFGTANTYQYLQKMMLKDVVSDMALVRKYEGISALKTTAQSAYAGANIGLAIPVVYSKVFADKYKEDEEDGQYSADFKANQRVLPIAYGVYALGVLPLFKTPFKAEVINPILNKTRKFGPLISIPFGIKATNSLFFSRPQSRPANPASRSALYNSFNLPTPQFDFTPVKYQSITPEQTSQQDIEEEIPQEEEETSPEEE